MHVSFDVLLPSLFSLTFTLISHSSSFLPRVFMVPTVNHTPSSAFSLSSLMDTDTKDAPVMHWGKEMSYHFYTANSWEMSIRYTC